jgi:hypothetical protein
VGDQPVSVRRDFYGETAAIARARSGLEPWDARHPITAAASEVEVVIVTAVVAALWVVEIGRRVGPSVLGVFVFLARAPKAYVDSPASVDAAARPRLLTTGSTAIRVEPFVVRIRHEVQLFEASVLQLTLGLQEPATEHARHTYAAFKRFRD